MGMHASQFIAQVAGSRTTADDTPGTGWGAVPFFVALVATLVITMALKRWLKRGLPPQGNAGETVEAGTDSDTSESTPGSEAKSERHSVPKHGA